jgi:tRNA(Ile)-lysidine synthase
MPPRGFPSWPETAAALAAAVPRERLHPAAVGLLEARPPRERWAVALSGGADSVALLLLVLAHWPERRRALLALHFDHRLRGAASAADARFCARLCRHLGVALLSGRWRRPVPAAASARARGERFGFLDDAMRRRRISVLLLGHHRDDVAESLLMRLARGSGAAGLAAPRPVQRIAEPRGRRRLHIRPLLNLRKAEITAALRAGRVPWREDASNAQDGHFRNRVRHRVIPAWIRAAERDAVAGAAGSRELLEEDDSALEAWVRDLGAVRSDGSFDLSAVAGKPRAVVRRALHQWLLLQRVADLSRPAFEALLGAVMGGTPTRQSAGTGRFAVIRRGRLRMEGPRRARGTRAAG